MNKPGDIAILNLVNRKRDGTWDFYQNRCDDILLAVQSFGHLIPYGRNMTNQAFAEIIEYHYDIENPKTRHIVDSLTCEGLV